MPSTRSQGRAQPTLQFPRRKSCRESSRSKTPQPQKSPLPSPSKPERQRLTSTGPLSPRRPAVQLTPLSPGRLPPSSPGLQPRLPLSPRKRTGDDNGCNLGAALLGSPPKQSRPTLASPRKLGFDENSPVTARRQLVPSSPRQPLSPAVALSPRRQETPAGSPLCFVLRLLVLDEMDQLDSKAQDVLYTIFEWPYLPQSRLCLVGIANALDLTDRILPRLQARPHCRPLLLHFPPYSRQELTAIVQDRLAQASADGILDASAVQFCARKVSAVSGDARKALDICRRAVEIVESDERKKATDSKAETKASRVSLPQVARVLSEVYGDRMAAQSGGSEGESFPLQQKLLVCCLLLLIRNGKSKEIVLGKLHEVYSRLCAQRQVSGVGQGECLSLCGLLESRGIFALKKAKEARLTKVFLKIEEKDVENALKDRTLLGSILAAGLPS
ncbi:cell division control protein 6 homolog [Seriola lalandi dorsalis]|uniref:cell division control protein 6 homolog n=1 Tax=Seriola lalandi dorsalis TaxID=1841481 RepID=UPI000C6F8AAE|nr:cell division control protein 6 homolog [Seriola lalandi dorsalis]